MNSFTAKQFALDAVRLPGWGQGSFYLWRRNFLYFKQNLLGTFTWIFLEPVLYLLALGFGLGRFVAEIEGQSYVHFIAPGIMAMTGMMTAFFEATYSTFTKLHRQNTYQTIILTPLSSDEIVWGEILWCTSKSFLSVCSVGLALLVMGIISIHGLAPALVILLLMCWVFSALGIFLATVAKSFEWFSYFQTCLLTPMALFCGTYFPLSQLPDGVKYIAYALPLTHALSGARLFLSGTYDTQVMIPIIYLIFLGIIFSNVAAARFERKLIL